MAAFLDICRFIPSAGGTADWAYSSAVTGYVGPAVAGAVDGIRYKYRAESSDLSQWEVGEGTYTLATNTLSRDAVLVNSSGDANRVNFGAIPQVAIVALSDDVISSAYGIVNHSLAVSAAGGNLTIALKDAAGNDPTPISPVKGFFGSASGPLTRIAVASALSVTIPWSGMFGIVPGQAFRLWAVLFNDAGMPRLGVIRCSDGAHIYPLTEGRTVSSSIPSSGSTLPGSFYTDVAVASAPFLIVGYAEWSSAGIVATAVWDTTNLLYVQAFGPGIKKPGDVVQKVYTAAVFSATQNPSSTVLTAAAGSGLVIAPSSAANRVSVRYTGSQLATAGGAGNNTEVSSQIGWNGAAAPFSNVNIVGVVSASGTNQQTNGALALAASHTPNSTGAQTYTVMFAGLNSFGYNIVSGVGEASEIMA